MIQSVICDHPGDFPEHWVVREYVIVGTDVYPARIGVLFDDLDSARTHAARGGKVCIGRMPGDDSRIYEVWI